MIDLEIYINFLAGRSIRAIREAEQEARRRSHQQITPDHILAVIAKSEAAFFNEVLIELHHNPQIAAQEIEARLAGYRGRKNGVGMSEEMRWFLQNSLIQAHKQNRRLVEPEDFLNVYYTKKPGVVERLINAFGNRKI